MAGPASEPEARRAASAGPGLAVALAVLLVLGLLLTLLLTDALERGSDGGAAVDQAVPADAYRDVVLGIDPEALTERLLPARPAQDLTATGADDVPPTPEGTRCLYYASGAEVSGHYRFCFADDRLVDKAVVRADG